MTAIQSTLSEFLAEVVMTGYYLSEPSKNYQIILHDSEMKCLKIIDKFGPIQLQVLAGIMYTSKSRITQIVNCLIDKDLVQKNYGADHRVKLVTTTSAGKDYVNSVKNKYDNLSMQIIDKLGLEDSYKLVEILQKITPLAKVSSTTGAEEVKIIRSKK